MRISRFLSRVLTRRVHCANCPNFRPISERKKPLGADGNARVMVGACALDRVMMTTYPRVIAAFPVKYPHDWCEKHPSYSPHKGADLTYQPNLGERGGHGAAGFNRAPSLREAFDMQTNKVKDFALPKVSADNSVEFTSLPLPKLNSVKGDKDAPHET